MDISQISNHLASECSGEVNLLTLSRPHVAGGTQLSTKVQVVEVVREAAREILDILHDNGPHDTNKLHENLNTPSTSGGIGAPFRSLAAGKTLI
jgi:hypothetical protein